MRIDGREPLKLQIERLPPVKFSMRPSSHLYLNGTWTPQYQEVSVTDLDVIEVSIPADTDGVYLRKTENQLHDYHPFDGEG